MICTLCIRQISVNDKNSERRQGFDFGPQLTTIINGGFKRTYPIPNILGLAIKATGELFIKYTIPERKRKKGWLVAVAQT